MECSAHPVSNTFSQNPLFPQNGQNDHFLILKRHQITIASGNQHKVEEIVSMLGPLPIEVTQQPSHINTEETGSTYLENALLKARETAQITNTWTIADDSGLEVDALNGAPGLFSARFAETNKEKIDKILTALGDTPYRSARFLSVMVLCSPKGELIKDAEGVCWGELLKSPAYEGGEFESLLWVKEANCTYGELNQQQLSRLGTRGKAARIIAPYLRQAFGLEKN